MEEDVEETAAAPCQVLWRCWDNWAITDVLCSWIEHGQPQASWMDIEADSIAADYNGILQKARSWSEGKQAPFFHILQPTLFTASLSPYEQQLSLDYGVVPVAMDIAYRTMWPKFRQTNGTIDLSDAL